MHTAIRTALETTLATVSGIPAAASRATENVLFEPTPGTTWLASRLSPGPRQLLTLPARQGWVRERGSWRLTLHFPIGTGTTVSGALVAAILAAFPAGLTVPTGTFDVHIDGGRAWSAAQADAEYTIPIDIYWHVLVVNPLT